jgi:ankyrin repeat protein
VQRKHLMVARILLDAGADVNIASDYHARTPLHYAVQSENRCTDLLLERGATVDARDHAGITPLITAAMAGYAGVVPTLLARGAEVDARSESGATALLSAAGELAVDVVEALLAVGADPRIPNLAGWTPLHAAIGALADHGQDGLDRALAILDLLIARGASPDAATTDTLVFGGDELSPGATPADVVAKLPHKRLRAPLGTRIGSTN